MLRGNMDEMDIQPIDLGHELRQGVQSRLDLAPVVAGLPEAREFLDRRQWRALRFAEDGLLLRPARLGAEPVQGCDLGGRLSIGPRYPQYLSIIGAKIADIHQSFGAGD